MKKVLLTVSMAAMMIVGIIKLIFVVGIITSVVCLTLFSTAALYVAFRVKEGMKQLFK